MKFKIYWLENHLCYDEKEEKEILDTLPIGSKVTSRNYDGAGTEFECVDIFEANNIEEAKQKIINEYDIPNDVFTVFNAETDERLFTEEDL